MRTKTNHWTMYEIEYIQSHCETLSNVEMAAHLNILPSRVKSIMKYYYIKRSKQAVSNIRSRVSLALVEREKERVKHGLPQLTKYKLNKKFLAQYGNT